MCVSLFSVKWNKTVGFGGRQGAPNVSERRVIVFMEVSPPIAPFSTCYKYIPCVSAATVLLFPPWEKIYGTHQYTLTIHICIFAGESVSESVGMG